MPKKNKNKKEPFTAKKKKQFLTLIANYYNVDAACKTVNVWRGACYKARKDDAIFREAWDEAKSIGMDSLEDVLIHIGDKGITKEIWENDELVRTETTSDPRTIKYLLAVHNPEKYNLDKNNDKDDKPINITINIPKDKPKDD